MVWLWAEQIKVKCKMPTRWNKLKLQQYNVSWAFLRTQLYQQYQLHQQHYNVISFSSNTTAYFKTKLQFHLHVFGGYEKQNGHDYNYSNICWFSSLPCCKHHTHAPQVHVLHPRYKSRQHAARDCIHHTQSSVHHPEKYKQKENYTICVMFSFLFYFL